MLAHLKMVPINYDWHCSNILWERAHLQICIVLYKKWKTDKLFGMAVLLLMVWYVMKELDMNTKPYLYFDLIECHKQNETNWHLVITLPKAQRTWGFSSYHKITVHKCWTYYNFRISIKHWLFKISEYWPRYNFVPSTKHQQQNTDQTSASK